MRERYPSEGNHRFKKPLRYHAARLGAAGTFAAGAMGIGTSAMAAENTSISDHRPTHVVMEDNGDQNPSPRRYPTKEQVEQAKSDYNDKQMKVLGWFVGSFATAGAAGWVLSRRQRRREDIEKTFYLNTAITLSDEQAEGIADRLRNNAIPKKEARTYGINLEHQGSEPPHEFSTTNEEVFGQVAKKLGVSDYKIDSAVFDYGERQEEEPNPPHGDVNALIVRAEKNKKGEVKYTTKIGKRFFKGN